MLDGDRRDQRLGAVAAGHAEAVGAACDRVARELFEIEPAVEHHGLHAEIGGKRYEAELLDLAAARPRIAEQHRMSRRTPGTYADVELVEVAQHRGACATRA